MQIIIYYQAIASKSIVFWVIEQILDFNDVILSGQSKTSIIKSQRVVYQQNGNFM